MLFAMERFVSSEQPSNSLTADRCTTAFPYRVQCRACSFEHPNAMARPRRCPKCAGGAWERFAFPRSLLMYADRRAEQGRVLCPAMVIVGMRSKNA
jgi:hypothetical protein